MFKGDLAREKMTRLQLQKVAKANQITLKRLQIASAIKNSLQKCKYCPMVVNTNRSKLCKPCFVKNAKASGAKSRGNQLAKKREGQKKVSGFAGCWCQPSQLQRIRRMMVPRVPHVAELQALFADHGFGVIGAMVIAAAMYFSS